MKFPYELSEQRISLLSKEDQRIYRFEHSDFFDVSERERCMQEYQNALLERQGYYIQEIKNDSQFNHLNESEIIETANELTLYENDVLIEQVCNALSEVLGSNILLEDEIIESLSESINGLHEASVNILGLNEDQGDTTGPDMTYWAKGLGGLFGGVLSLMIALLMRGKTKMAIRMLEKYMNEIVEKVDDGVNKTKGRGLFNRIKVGLGKLFKKDWSGKNSGEQNTMCLRIIQENFQADIATKSMIMCKKLGLLPDTWDKALPSIKNSDFTQGSFYKVFMKNIAEPLNDLGNLKSME